MDDDAFIRNLARHPVLCDRLESFMQMATSTGISRVNVRSVYSTLGIGDGIGTELIRILTYDDMLFEKDGDYYTTGLYQVKGTYSDRIKRERNSRRFSITTVKDWVTTVGLVLSVTFSLVALLRGCHNEGDNAKSKSQQYQYWHYDIPCCDSSIVVPEPPIQKIFPKDS